MIEHIRYYLAGQAPSWPDFKLEQLILGLCSWVPTIVGIGLRGLAYRLIMKLDGIPAIEAGVRIAHANGVRLGKGVHLDQGVCLQALPGSITIGDNVFIMHHTTLHVFNFRNLPQSGITIGKNCVIGEFNVVRGQGAVRIGDGVYTGPMVQIVAVNRVNQDPSRSVREQVITARGIVIEDNVWIGAGAIVVDGVTIGKGSIIGAGAVVTGNIPPFSIAVGTPARPIKDCRHLGNNHRQEVDVFLGMLEEFRGA